jgi:hypothetical protein
MEGASSVVTISSFNNPTNALIASLAGAGADKIMLGDMMLLILLQLPPTKTEERMYDDEEWPPENDYNTLESVLLRKIPTERNVEITGTSFMESGGV